MLDKELSATTIPTVTIPPAWMARLWVLRVLKQELQCSQPSELAPLLAAVTAGQEEAAIVHRP